MYKCFIKTLLQTPPNGGILIIPLNFWSSIREADTQLRKDFLKLFRVHRINIFEEQVFDDTSYTICSFAFDKFNGSGNDELNCFVYPRNKQMLIPLTNGIIGGELYTLPINTDYTIERLTKTTKHPENTTNINLHCIDTPSKPLGLTMVASDETILDNTPNLSMRSFATIVITPPIPLERQQILVKQFNKFITDKRAMYHSLFLTNYRDKYRKRISFQLCFRILGYLLK